MIEFIFNNIQLITLVVTVITAFATSKAAKASSKAANSAEKSISNSVYQFDKQNFENKLSSFLEQNKYLVEQIYKKFNSFEFIYKEFAYIYDIAYKKHENKMKIDEIIKKAYDISYYGSEYYSNLLKQNEIKEIIKNVNTEFKDTTKKNKITPKNELLGIYYRNIFQCIKLIHYTSFLNKEEKKEYAKFVRTQVSDFAQLMLYYNTFTVRGSAWLDDKKEFNVKLLLEYKMIKNCPLLNDSNTKCEPFLKFVGIEPHIYFKNDIEEDEFEYIKLRKN